MTGNNGLHLEVLNYTLPGLSRGNSQWKTTINVKKKKKETLVEVFDVIKLGYCLRDLKEVLISKESFHRSAAL